ncbi:MAG: hypothetical protein HY834_17725 [Devosia nanyangense]|uniref:DUF7662 domain-containing protein n=1 Tax=Devosia nanyangense TaxID=1228055 RepID=A0A933L5X9_9HYPH|nr:hypothetical protein [Devosia nanyangense]
MSIFATDGTKYHPLFEHLLYSGHGQSTMTFAEIESVIEARLPPSARTRAEWWSNSPSGHSQARAWMRAGYSTSKVDLEAGEVTFTLGGWPDGYVKPNFINRQREAVAPGLGERAQTLLEPAEGGSQQDHPLFGVWEGRVTLVPGFDYTKPALEPDDAVGE